MMQMPQRIGRGLVLVRCGDGLLLLPSFIYCCCLFCGESRYCLFSVVVGVGVVGFVCTVLNDVKTIPATCKRGF